MRLGESAGDVPGRVTDELVAQHHEALKPPFAMLAARDRELDERLTKPPTPSGQITEDYLVGPHPDREVTWERRSEPAPGSYTRVIERDGGVQEGGTTERHWTAVTPYDRNDVAIDQIMDRESPGGLHTQITTSAYIIKDGEGTKPVTHAGEAVSVVQAVDGNIPPRPSSEATPLPYTRTVAFTSNDSLSIHDPRIDTFAFWHLQVAFTGNDSHTIYGAVHMRDRSTPDARTRQILDPDGGMTPV